MAPQIWFIHGATLTPLCFEWLKGQLRPHVPVDVSYDSKTPLIETISYLRDEIAKCTTPPLIIGHSLGGVIGAAVAQTVPVAKIATISTPFGGAFAASLALWFMPSQLMRDIAQQSPILEALRKDPPTTPMLSFVTDSGRYILGEPTDGVVAVKSQMALNGPRYLTVKVNHFDVLINPYVVSQLNAFFFKDAL